MKLLPLDSPEVLELAAAWLAKEENYKWLDFGNGVQRVSPITLRIMTQRDMHVVRIYTSDPGDVPAGIVGLSNVDRHFRTAAVWAVLGNKRYGGCTTEAVGRMVTYGFTTLGLHAINAWTLEINVGGRRILERLNFRFIGRLRQCHYIDGRPYDRLLFDILATEHQENPTCRIPEASSHSSPASSATS